MCGTEWGTFTRTHIYEEIFFWGGDTWKVNGSRGVVHGVNCYRVQPIHVNTTAENAFVCLHWLSCAAAAAAAAAEHPQSGGRDRRAGRSSSRRCVVPAAAEISSQLTEKKKETFCSASQSPHLLRTVRERNKMLSGERKMRNHYQAISSGD